jgi:hypothetical protein
LGQKGRKSSSIKSKSCTQQHQHGKKERHELIESRIEWLKRTGKNVKQTT